MGRRGPVLATITVDITAKARRIRLVLLDVDGVLTDGRILVHADGSESKEFDIRDGAGIVLAQRAGLRVGLLSGRSAAATAARAAQLGIDLVVQGSAAKGEAFDRVVRQSGAQPHEIAYMGDDVMDLPALARAGLSAAPSDAVDEIRSRVDIVTNAPGGRGAVRELLEILLRAQDRWDAVVDEVAGEAQPGDAGAA